MQLRFTSVAVTSSRRDLHSQDAQETAATLSCLGLAISVGRAGLFVVAPPIKGGSCAGAPADMPIKDEVASAFKRNV